MTFSLNQEQAKGLAGFFFDVAKGLVLGGAGAAAISPMNLKIIAVISSASLAYVCVRIALVLLEDIK